MDVYVTDHQGNTTRLTDARMVVMKPDTPDQSSTIRVKSQEGDSDFKVEVETERFTQTLHRL